MADLRNHFSFAEFAEASWRELPDRWADQSPAEIEIIPKMARRYALSTLGSEAHILEWVPSPMTHPKEAEVRLEGTDHILRYRPSRLTGDYELVLERYCRLCVKTEHFTITSLTELGAYLAGKDNR